MTVQKIRSGRITSIVADTYIGEKGTIFYNEALGDLRLSNGITPGGIFITTSGTGTGTALSIKSSGSILTTTTSSINFTGSGVITTSIGNDVTVTIQGNQIIQNYNLDGGYPFSIYGGVTNIDGGPI